MGNTYDEDSNVSILLRYSSDNDTPDMVFTSQPTRCATDSDAGSPPPPAPIPMRLKPESKEQPKSEDTNLDLRPHLPDAPKTVRKEIKSHADTISHLNQFSDSPLKNVVCKLHNLDMKKLPKKLFKKKSQVLLNSNGKTVEYNKSNGWKKSGCFCWVSQCASTLGGFSGAICELHQRAMDWVLLYSGRPSGSGIRRDGISVAEKEMREAEDFVNNNMHIPLEELAKQNLELQREKEIEHELKRTKKAPTLDEQERGENGRIIYSQEYIDYILYRDYQPLVDLRVLKMTGEIIQQKIIERDAAKLAAELEAKAAIKEAAVVRAGRVRRVVRKIVQWTVNLTNCMKLGRSTRTSSKK